MKYFAKREIRKRLEGMNDSQKIVYLRRALGKKSLISHDTADILNKELGRLYEKRAKDSHSGSQEEARYLSGAAEAYASTGNLKKAERLLENAHFKKNIDWLEREQDIHRAYTAHSYSKRRRGDKKKSRLEQTAVTAIIGIAGGIFFLSSNITGNAIGSMSNSTSSIIGVVLLVAGLVVGFFCFKGRKKK